MRQAVRRLAGQSAGSPSGELAHGYARRQMSAFVELQQAEFAAAERGFTAVKH